ncbi:MAG: tRNA (adenosine(37)-N6)-threonylcarbamoyltransferase complex ATPase subunit type 1 TsaE [Candidatus Colwellbacteria bacterium]|nr:tRNA (adenosine(37)-N6)-threonylcarbamoyltransferase complex ATPase subunit type 1 TsaE [Candidatus Colwellbacteria bacterium]
MAKVEFSSQNPRETGDLAKSLAQEILKTEPGKKALVIGFIGELGSGKTTFIKALIRMMGTKSRIVSPTFIFSRPYKLARKPISTAWHFDLYRLGSGKEVKAIGLKEAISNPQNLVLVEWADKTKQVLPEETIWIVLRHGKKQNERHITFNRR